MRMRIQVVYQTGPTEVNTRTAKVKKEEFRRAVEILLLGVPRNDNDAWNTTVAGVPVHQIRAISYAADDE